LTSTRAKADDDQHRNEPNVVNPASHKRQRRNAAQGTLRQPLTRRNQTDIDCISAALSTATAAVYERFRRPGTGLACPQKTRPHPPTYMWRLCVIARGCRSGKGPRAGARLAYDWIVGSGQKGLALRSCVTTTIIRDHPYLLAKEFGPDAIPHCSTGPHRTLPRRLG
jgi:hypothetical protein